MRRPYAASHALLRNVCCVPSVCPWTHARSTIVMHTSSPSDPLSPRPAPGLGLPRPVPSRAMPVPLHPLPGPCPTPLHTLCSMSGTFVLVIPGLLVGASWWGLVIVPLCGFAMHHAAQCVTCFVLDDKLLLTYRDVGEKALGSAGSYLVFALQMANCIFAAVICINLGADNLGILCRHYTALDLSPEQFLALATLCTLPFCFFRNLDNIGLVSLVGYLVSLFAVMCCVADVFIQV